MSGRSPVVSVQGRAAIEATRAAVQAVLNVRWPKARHPSECRHQSAHLGSLAQYSPQRLGDER